MSTKQITTSTLWQIGSQALMALLSAVSAKFVAMGLSQELAGTYNTSYGFLQLFAILADFGLYAVSVREVSIATDKQKVLGALLTLRTMIATLSLGAAVMIAWIVPAWTGTPLPLGITIAAFVPFFTLLAGVLRTTFQITYSMHYVFIAEVSQRILTALLMAGIIVFGVRLSDDVRVLHLFLGIGSLGALLLLLFSVVFSLRLMPIRFAFDRVLLRRLFISAMPYGAAFLCIALYRQFDLTMIALLRSDFKTQNAIYGFANRIAEMTYLVPTFLLNSTLPMLSERSSKGEHTDSMLGKTFLIILVMSSASALFSFFWAMPIMRLLTTDAYLATRTMLGSDTALSLLSAPMVLNGIVLFSFYVLLTKHAWKPLVFLMVIAVILSIICNVLWIPSLGFIGAIRTSTVVHLFLACTLFPMALRTMPMLFPSSYALRFSAFVVVLSIMLGFATPYIHTVAESILALLIGGLLTIGLGVLCGFHAIFTSSSHRSPVEQ